MGRTEMYGCMDDVFMDDHGLRLEDGLCPFVCTEICSGSRSGSHVAQRRREDERAGESIGGSIRVKEILQRGGA